MLYEATYPIVDNFVNLAIIQENEKKQTEENLKTDQYPDRRVNSFEDIHKPKKPIQLEAIFDKQQNDKIAPKRLIIEGRAGIGKTTLCQYMANQWSADNGRLTTWHKQFELVIWLPLREIAIDSKIDFENYTLSELIYYRFISSDEKEEHTLEAIKKELRELIKTEKLLAILDGYDEIASLLEANASFKKFITEQLLNRPYWILTSRPYYTSHLKPDRRLENIGFISEDIPLYIQKFFHQIQQENLIDQKQKTAKLLGLLKSNPNIHGIAHIPINLELICSSWEQDKTILESPLSMAALYDRLVLNLLRRYLHKFQNKSLQEATLLEWPDILQIPLCQQILNFLAALAWDAMQKPDVILSATTIKALALQHFPNTQQRFELSQAILKDVGLLKAFGAHTKSPLDQDHYFIHLTFQEYFAARYFISHWEEQKQRIEKFNKNNRYQITWWHIAFWFVVRSLFGLWQTNHIDTHIEMINKNMHDNRYQIVWWFVAGLLGLWQKNNTTMLKTFFELLTNHLKKESNDYESQLLLTLHCWNESGLVDLSEEWLENLVYTHLIKRLGDFDSYGITGYLVQNIQLSQRIAHHICLNLLENNSDYIRQLAIRALMVLNVKTEPVIQGLLKLLQDPKMGICRLSAKALIKLEIEEIKTNLLIHNFLKLLQNSDYYVRRVVAHILIALKVKTNLLIQELLKLLQVRDHSIRCLVVHILGRLGIKTEPVIEGLFGLLQDLNSEVRREVVEAFWRLEIKSGSIIQRFLKLLQHPASYVRSTVISILGKLEIKTTLVIQKLLDLLLDPDSDIRYMVAVILNELGFENIEKIKYYLSLLQNPKSNIRCVAANNLVKLEIKIEKVIQCYLGLLRESDGDVRYKAVDGLRGLGISIEDTLPITEKQYKKLKAKIHKQFGEIEAQAVPVNFSSFFVTYNVADSSGIASISEFSASSSAPSSSR